MISSSCHFDWRRIGFSERLVSMQEIFQVGARDSSTSIKLSSDSIRVVGSNRMLASNNRVQWKDSSQLMEVIAIKGRIQVIN